MTKPSKPPDVESDEFKSAKWDEPTRGCEFAQSDAPALALLCQWYKIAATAKDELDSFGGQTAYANEMGFSDDQIQRLRSDRAKATSRALVASAMAGTGLDLPTVNPDAAAAWLANEGRQ